MNSDENDEKRHYDCIIWPENHGSNEKKCTIHAYERRVLLGNGSMSSRLHAWPNQENPQYVALIFFTIESTRSEFNAFTGQQAMNVEYKIRQQYAQRWDNGGCYLDPELVVGKMPWE